MRLFESFDKSSSYKIPKKNPAFYHIVQSDLLNAKVDAKTGVFPKDLIKCRCEVYCIMHSIKPPTVE